MLPTTTLTSTPPIDTTQCPLCGQANQCAMAQQPAPAQCWCMDSHIASAALADIPEAERGRRCICPACAAGQARQRLLSTAP